MIRTRTVSITLILFGLFAVQLSGEDQVGVVSDLRGNVMRSSPVNDDELKLGSTVFRHDTVKTDRKGFVVITLRNASSIAIGAETELVVDDWLAAQNSNLEIVSGQLGFETDEDTDENVETIRTVFGMIGVRG